MTFCGIEFIIPIVFVLSLSLLFLVLWTSRFISSSHFKQNRRLLYDHTLVPVTSENIKTVTKLRKTLLKRMLRVLKKYNIDYVISHGNLIEAVRGSPIIQDDDIDIRIASYSFDNWMKYCKSLGSDGIDRKNGLILDHRVHDREKQKYNGIQLFLLDPEKIVKNMNTKFKDIHVDVVVSNCGSSFWINYDSSFLTPPKEITYMGIKGVKIPADYNVISDLLRKDYGKDFIVPLKKSFEINGKFYYN